MILDTTFIIDLMENNEDAIKKLKEIASKSEPHVITTPTVFELYSGVIQSNKPEKEKQKVLNVLSNIIVWNLELDTAKKAGEIDGKLAKDGKTIDPEDCMIAGIALTKGQKILTRNIKHFSRIHGLEIESY